MEAGSLLQMELCSFWERGGVNGCLEMYMDVNFLKLSSNACARLFLKSG